MKLPVNKAKPAVLWLLVVLWAAVIFFMSAKTGSDLISGDDFVSRVRLWLDSIQKSVFGPEVDIISSIAHFLEFTVLGILVYVALISSGIKKRVAVIAILICAIYAATDEFHQIFVPGRQCDPIDWIVDVAGSSLGVFLYLLLHRRTHHATHTNI